MKIGDLAAKSGLSERTLRHYEGLGIIRPRRSAGGTRHYGEADLAIARTIHNLRELDIPVDVIRAIATTREQFETGDQSSRAMTGVLEDLIDQLGERAAKTLALQDELIRAARLVAGCRGCRNRPNPSACPDCPLETGRAESPLVGLIWRDDP